MFKNKWSGKVLIAALLIGTIWQGCQALISEDGEGVAKITSVKLKDALAGGYTKEVQPSFEVIANIGNRVAVYLGSQRISLEKEYRGGTLTLSVSSFLPLDESTLTIRARGEDGSVEKRITVTRVDNNSKSMVLSATSRYMVLTPPTGKSVRSVTGSLVKLYRNNNQVSGYLDFTIRNNGKYLEITPRNSGTYFANDVAYDLLFPKGAISYSDLGGTNENLLFARAIFKKTPFYLKRGDGISSTLIEIKVATPHVVFYENTDSKPPIPPSKLKLTHNGNNITGVFAEMKTQTSFLIKRAGGVGFGFTPDAGTKLVIEAEALRGCIKPIDVRKTCDETSSQEAEFTF